MIDVPAIFRELVQNVSTTLGKPIYFDCGSRKEIVAHLDQKGKGISTKAQKFPLVWLVFPFTKSIGRDGVLQIPDIAIYIANETKRESSTQQRIVDNFIPTIYPIYEELMKEIEESEYLDFPGMRPSHQLIDWPFWGDPEGKQDQNPLNEIVDAALIKNLNLIINEEECDQFQLVG